MHLPQDLIVEILLRLPVKSLLRFKCICKSWFSLISDPSFTTSHFELAAARTERLLIVPLNSGIQSIDFNASLHDDSATASVNNKFFNPRYYHSNVEIKGSCQGFILLDLEHAFCIWNPSTGVHKIVDWSPMLYDSGGIFSFLGLGYDSSTDDYLIFLMSNHDVHDVNASRAEVFSFRANAWKEIEATYSGDSVNKEAGLFFNGFIHWFAFNDDILKHVIVAFDCTERRFSEMHLPVDLDFHNFNFHKLRVLRESLNVCAVRRIQLSTEVWMMKKYKVQLFWTKIMSVSLNDIHGGFFLLLCYTRSGDLVGENYYGRVVKYNDKGHLQERGSYCDEPWRSMVVYTESLLSLP